MDERLSFDRATYPQSYAQGRGHGMHWVGDGVGHVTGRVWDGSPARSHTTHESRHTCRMYEAQT
jgi:hypothetical protein